jgi:hypothetical protein
MGPDRTVVYGEPLSERPAGAAPGGVDRFLVQLLKLAAERQYGTADPVDLFPRMFAIPWAADEAARLQRFLANP